MTLFCIGCQTYTWEMLGKAWTGGPDDLVAAIAAGGYAGIEITDTMIGWYANDAPGFAAALDRAGLALVAYTIAAPSGFTEPDRVDDDIESVRRAAGFTAAFPGALLVLGSATVMSPGARAAKFDVAAEVYNRAFRAAAEAGADLAIHPSSHKNTLLESESDYAEMFDRLDPAVGWVPDTGHLLRGGQRLDAALARWAGRIRYVHIKDVDAAGRWAMLGEGVVDPAAVARLVSAAPTFTGWLVAEEESDTAALDPAAAVKRNHARLVAALGV